MASELNLKPVEPLDLAPLVESADWERLTEKLTTVMLVEAYGEVIDVETLRLPLQAALLEKGALLAALLEGSASLDDIRSPAALRFAADVGRLGLSESRFERSYRVGQTALFAWWMTAVDEFCARSGDDVTAVLQQSTAVIFGFVDRMLALSIVAFHDAVAERRRSHVHRRSVLTEQILDGTLPEPGVDAERFLDYPFAQTHLAAVLGRAEGGDDTGVVAALAEAAEATSSLVLKREDGTTVAWLGFRTPPSRRVLAVLEQAAASQGRPVALGDPRPHVPGFRATAAAAIDTAAVQRLTDDEVPCLWSRDAQVEILGLRCPAACRRIVEDELGPVLGQEFWTEQVRQTLDAWLVTGSNVGAAARLGVHEQTVRNRLRRIEDALGHVLNDRRTELHLALRLSRLDLGASPRPT